MNTHDILYSLQAFPRDTHNWNQSSRVFQTKYLHFIITIFNPVSLSSQLLSCHCCDIFSPALSASPLASFSAIRHFETLTRLNERSRLPSEKLKGRTPLCFYEMSHLGSLDNILRGDYYYVHTNVDLVKWI